MHGTQNSVVLENIYSDTPETLDAKILKLLVERAIICSKNFYGLSFRNIIRALDGKSIRGGGFFYSRMSIKKTGEVKAALRTLKRGGLVYTIKRSKLRYFPSTRAVVAHGFATGSQERMEEFL